MSFSKSASSSDELSSEHFITVCGICLSVYDVPKALPCLHSFCLSCIREWPSHISSDIGGTGSSHVVSCPTCRKDCVLPESGVEDLPTNFFITQRDRIEEIPKCKSCGKDNCDVVARCCECGFVCNECMVSHKSMQMLKSHTVIMLDALRFGKAGTQLSMLHHGWLHVTHNKKPGSGTFELDKTINLTRIDSSLSNVWCCSLNSSGSSYYEIAAPAYSSSKVYIFGTDGKKKLVIDTKEGTPPGQSSSPWNAALTSDGQFYITDCHPWVRVHNKEGQMTHLIPIREVDGSKCTSGRAMGITIDNKGQIIVGNTSTSSQTIGIYKADESLINAFKVDLKPYFVNVISTNNSILVSGNQEDYVLEVDYSGQILHKIRSPIETMTWKPRGVCCSNGEIYIVNSAKDQCCVCRFAKSCNFTGCISVMSDLKDPYGIAISKDGELLTIVDSRAELKIYRRT